MTDSPPSSAAVDDAATPSTPTKSKLKKIPHISNRHPQNGEFAEENETRAPNDGGENDESSPIAASMLGLNSIRTTRSTPVNPRNSGPGVAEKRDNGAARRKFIVPDIPLSPIEIPGKRITWSQSTSIRSPPIRSPLNTTPEGNGALIRETKSPRFQAVPCVTNGRKKKTPDVKSFSHELNSKGVRPYPFLKSRAFGHMEEVMVKLRAKFNQLKDEVDSDLGIFAGDLVDTLEKSTEPHHEWKEGLEDLLLIARKCAKMSADEFWCTCESIVQGLDDRRQELPMGTLKRAHIRLLFILTRCTRLVQLQKEGVQEEEHILNLHKLSDVGVYAEQIAGLENLDIVAKKDSKEKPRKKSHKHQHSLTLKHDHLCISGIDGMEGGTARSTDSSASSYRMMSWKKFPSAAEKQQQGDADTVGTPFKDLSGAFQHIDESIGTPGSPAGNTEPPTRRVSWGVWGEQQHIANENLMICRICEVEIPAVFVEEHSRICTVADRCDLKGLTVNERLERVAETLEKILESWSPRSTSTAGATLDITGISTSSTPEELDELSPKKNGFSCTLSDDLVESFPESHNNFVMDDLNAVQGISFESNCSSDIKSLSAGSLTPRSILTTPRTSQIESLLHKRKIISEHENNQQIKKLVDIARSVADINSSDYNALEYMTDRLEDLKYSIQDRKVDALVVETFGRRIEKLLQEKYLQLYGQIDDDKPDSSLILADDEGSPDDDTVRSVRASPLNPCTKDRTSIEDFEILKPISRGAYGRVFLARKRATGDLFAMKVLKKADMICKNAVEGILAERNILMTARNPFVVRFYYSFTCKENLYLVMEYLNGGDLYSLLRNLGCLDEDMARVYIAEVVLALEYLHKLNVVHRDLKPDNLLIGADGHIKLTDFGLSKVGLINSTDDLSGPSVGSSDFLGHEKPDSATKFPRRREQRQKHSVVGTPDYLAPEILLGMGHGATADWWSVGVILFELLVGIPPFNAEHPQQIFDNIMNRDIPWPKVPEEMSYAAYDLINKLLRENPAQRLGATGAREVKAHLFFKGINWETLERQKAMFVPSTEGAFDTSYFMSRYIWKPEEDPVFGSSDFDDMSVSGSDSYSSGSFSTVADEDGDECGKLADFGNRNLAVKYSFSNFSFKSVSNLASINYDMVVKSMKDRQDQSEPSVQ